MLISLMLMLLLLLLLLLPPPLPPLLLLLLLPSEVRPSCTLCSFSSLLYALLMPHSASERQPDEAGLVRRRTKASTWSCRRL